MAHPCRITRTYTFAILLLPVKKQIGHTDFAFCRLILSTRIHGEAFLFSPENSKCQQKARNAFLLVVSQCFPLSLSLFLFLFSPASCCRLEKVAFLVIEQNMAWLVRSTSFFYSTPLLLQGFFARATCFSNALRMCTTNELRTVPSGDRSKVFK